MAPQPPNQRHPNGAYTSAIALKNLGITTIFGLTGFPITALAEEAINLGIKFIGFRNEQAASYAATAYGFLTGKPGCCLVVGGPGVVHGMAGVRLPFLGYWIELEC
jgi:2-hydroxyacyl-CoA lyase 1